MMQEKFCKDLILHHLKNRIMKEYSQVWAGPALSCGFPKDLAAAE
jgi:hypothetical protein